MSSESSTCPTTLEEEEDAGRSGESTSTTFEGRNGAAAAVVAVGWDLPRTPPGLVIKWSAAAVCARSRPRLEDSRGASTPASSLYDDALVPALPGAAAAAVERAAA